MVWQSIPSQALLAGQVGLILPALLALAFAPPANGRMILMPLTTDAMERMIPLAVLNGALLVAPGPRRTMIVVGERSRLAGALMRAGVLVLAAPPAGCGAAIRRPTP